MPELPDLEESKFVYQQAAHFVHLYSWLLGRLRLIEYGRLDAL